MSMTSKALTGLAAIALAAVLFFVLRGDSEDSGGSTPAKEAAAPAGEAAKDNSKRSGREGGNAEGEKKSAGGGAQAPGSADEVATIVVKGGEPVGGVAELSFAKGEAIRFRVESDVAEEIHMHGYDVSKDVERGRRGPLRRAGVDRGHLRGRARALGRADRRDHGEPELTLRDGLVSALDAAAHRRPRADRTPGPADSGVAVRLGRLAGPDRLVRRPLARLALEPRFEGESWRPLSARPVAGARQPAHRGALRPALASSCSGLSSCRASAAPRLRIATSR